MRTLAIAALGALALAGAAQANEVLDFRYLAEGGPSGTEYGYGVITLGDVGSSGYQDLLDITGAANGSPITGLSDFAGADNRVYDSGPLVSQGGISFATASGTDYNFYSFTDVGGPTTYKVLASFTDPSTWDSNASPIVHLCLDPVVSGAPEPSAWSLMLLGVGALGVALRTAKRAPKSMVTSG